MSYPRELRLSKDTEERLISYLEDELSNHMMEKGAHTEDIMRFQRDYWSKPATERATFPFTGASTIVIPLTAIAVETIHARTMTTLFALPQFVTVRAVSKAYTNHARPYERHIDRELKENAKMYDSLNNCVLENTKFGTMVGKTGYERIVRRAVRDYNGVEQEFDVVQRNSADSNCVPLTRFVMPFGAKDAQSSPWCGEEHEKTPFEVMGLVNGGLFRADTWDKLRVWVSRDDLGGEGHKFQQQQEELEQRQPSWPRTIHWYEIWLSFNVDGEPVVDPFGNRIDEGAVDDKEIVVHYHRDSRTIMSCRYNWYEDLHRPYRTGVYFPIEHRWTGLGVAKQNEQFMREVTTQHRQRLDNATLANIRMIKISKLSGYGPKEPIFPGKMWFLDDMDHMETVQMGEIYPSAYNNESATLQYSQQRTGINEVTLGMPQVGTPGTATSDLARIQEGNKKFDFIYRNVKNFANELIIDAVANIHQFRVRDADWLKHAEGGELVAEALELSPREIRSRAVLDIRAAGQQENKIVDRQNWIQISPVYQQYIAGMLQLAQLSGDQKLAQEILSKGLTGATEIMRQLLETFDVRNIERIVLSTQETVGDGSQPAPNANGAAGAAPNGQGGRIPDLASLIPQLTNGGAPPTG